MWRFTPLFLLLGDGHLADVPVILPPPCSRPGLQSPVPYLPLSSARARNISLHGNVSTAADFGSNSKSYCTFSAGAVCQWNAVSSESEFLCDFSMSSSGTAGGGGDGGGGGGGSPIADDGMDWGAAVELLERVESAWDAGRAAAGATAARPPPRPPPPSPPIRLCIPPSGPPPPSPPRAACVFHASEVAALMGLHPYRNPDAALLGVLARHATHGAVVVAAKARLRAGDAGAVLAAALGGALEAIVAAGAAAAAAAADAPGVAAAVAAAQGAAAPAVAAFAGGDAARAAAVRAAVASAVVTARGDALEAPALDAAAAAIGAPVTARNDRAWCVTRQRHGVCRAHTSRRRRDVPVGGARGPVSRSWGAWTAVLRRAAPSWK